MMKWMEEVHLPFLALQHREKEHARTSLRRYLNGLLAYTMDWSVIERRKIMKLCATSKLKNGDKYCLAFHPSQTFRDLQELGGVRLKDVKDHTNSVGGSWGADTWACLVNDVADDFDSTEEGNAAGLENTKSKRALLIPVSIFTSAQIMKICDLLGQNEDYRRFGADEETPSGLQEDSRIPSSAYRNSTQVSGSQGLNLHVSCIEQPIEQHVEDDLVFDVLSEDTDFFNEESLNDMNNEEAEVSQSQEEVFQKIQCMECELSFDSEVNLNVHISKEHQTASHGSKSKPMNSKRNITLITRQDQSYHVCECGYSSTNKSACSRHKCRNGDSLLFHCKDCTKVCKNPGSLKRHTDSKHGKSQHGVLQVDGVTDCNSLSTVEDSISTSSALSIVESEHQETSNPEKNSTKAMESESTCSKCGKTLKNLKNLMTHLKKVHKVDGSLPNTSSNVNVEEENEKVEFPCSLCRKVLKTSANLKKHIEVVHREKCKDNVAETSENDACYSSRGRLYSARKK